MVDPYRAGRQFERFLGTGIFNPDRGNREVYSPPINYDPAVREVLSGTADIRG